MSKKSLALLLAVALLIGGAVGGTIAWLTDTTEKVTNTFSVGNIDIELLEHELKDGALLNTGCPTNIQESEHHEVSNNAYKIIPGTEQPKDPFVRVKANTEKCYLFIQVQPVNNETGNEEADNVATKYITYTINDEVWTQLKDDQNQPVIVNGGEIWYKEHNMINTTAVMLNILKGEEVTYDPHLTKDDIDKVGDNNKPTLNFKAFAVQKEAVGTAFDAWGKIPVSEYLPAPATN